MCFKINLFVNKRVEMGWNEVLHKLANSNCSSYIYRYILCSIELMFTPDGVGRSIKFLEESIFISVIFLSLNYRDRGVSHTSKHILGPGVYKRSTYNWFYKTHWYAPLSGIELGPYAWVVGSLPTPPPSK